MQSSIRRQGRGPTPQTRLRILAWLLALPLLAAIVRLGYLQLIERETYAVLASDQHDLESKLLPTRGKILVRDRVDGQLYPLATNRDMWLIYAVPRGMKDPIAVARELAPIVEIPEVDILTKLTRDPRDPYEPLRKDASTALVQAVKAKNIEGIGFVKTNARLYPEQGMGGQLIGFVAPDEHTGSLLGQYGIEGIFEKQLAGKVGSLVAEKDAGGRRLVIGDTHFQSAVNGSDVILTIDRTIQYQTCLHVKAAVEQHQADSGSIVIMDPNSGAILAMCSYPDFDPAEYGKIKDLSVLNNPAVFTAYEPGSIFKAFTMAAGLNEQKISPKTTYIDKGVEDIDGHQIHNSDLKAHGLQTMIQVLDESLNTGTVFVQRLLGKETFRHYVESFGFGKKTEIELAPEARGNVSSLQKKGSIFAATASYGQGITMTPMQLIAAYGALANGGKLMRPYVVDEIIHPDGTKERAKPQLMSQPIDARSSRLITGMLVSVVENGHGKRAGVPGYWVAGKTGTAQVSRTDGLGYEKDAAIGSFVGYAPASDPRFVMLIKMDHPRDVLWAESSAAPLFGEMAKFLLDYLRVPPERPISSRSVPVSSATTTPVIVSTSTKQ